MAEIRESGSDLILELTFLEKICAFHNSIRVPRNSLVSVKETDDPWVGEDRMRGFRAPGTGIPGVVMLGTLRLKKGKEFAAVYGKRTAKVYEFSSGPFRRWIVSDRSKESGDLAL